LSKYTFRLATTYDFFIPRTQRGRVAGRKLKKCFIARS